MSFVEAVSEGEYSSSTTSVHGLEKFESLTAEEESQLVINAYDETQHRVTVKTEMPLPDQINMVVISPKREPLDCNSDLEIKPMISKPLLNEHHVNSIPTHVRSISSITPHTDEKSCKCVFCDDEEPLTVLVKEWGLESYASGKVLLCGLCQYSTAMESEFNKHALTHGGEKSYACYWCAYKTSKINDDFKVHVRSHLSKKRFACNLCPYVAHEMYKLRSHIRRHTGEKPYACGFCSYRTFYKGVLKIHISKYHADGKALTCNLCNYKTYRNTFLVTHERTHTSKKPLTCFICNYQTIRKCDLRIHMKHHSNEGKLLCNSCDYAGYTKWDFKRHLEIHASEKSHV